MGREIYGGMGGNALFTLEGLTQNCADLPSTIPIRSNDFTDHFQILSIEICLDECPEYPISIIFLTHFSPSVII